MGLKLSRVCLLPVMLVWAWWRVWLNPLIAVGGGQQSSVSMHFPFQAWHSCLQLAMCRWQHLPTVRSSSKPSGDGDDQFSGLQKLVFQERKLAIWAKKRLCWVLVGPDEKHCSWTLPLGHHSGNSDFPFPETAFLFVGVPSESHCFSQWKVCVSALQTVFAYLRFDFFY